ncbi:hypothetical protein SAMN05660350_00201 [Geodermatophilus obscurus]|uniref:Uncharacterized protein n=1 Tax=Geodermatophilus obscurus TaxID=1861 RepID=A0A1M7RW20_9ACTN|nr:hypothetical protein [Geodermatophilus obscurus]SHN50567.1 hypothetical protein SAMN05660350_00201 [Geodermatophilus obscurus]
MSSSTQNRRRQVQRLALTGVGSAVLLVGIASTAGAAPGVVIPLAPTEVALFNYPIEKYDWAPMDPVNGPAGAAEPIIVQYGELLTVDLADELDPINAVVELEFPDGADPDTLPDKTYSTDPSATDPLVVAVVNGNDLEITLPPDDGVNGPQATLRIAPIEPDATVLGPEFTVDPLLEYELDLSATAPTATTLYPELVALAQVPCALTSTTPCPVAVTAGTTFTLELTADSALRDLDLTDLTGIEVALQSTADSAAAPVLLAVEASGSTATVTLPAELAAGSYALVLGQPMTSGLSIVVAELTVSAPAVPPPATETVAPAPQAVAVNAGLRSNTGVEAVETGSTGTVAVTAGAGMLVLAGVGGIAVARTRRRPAAEGGTCA